MRQLLIYSDSVIKGVMHENGRYKLCEDHDFASLNARGIEAHNHSKMGATIRTGLAIMRRKLAPCDEETLVLLSFGGNDCDYNWAEVAADPDGIHMPHIEPDEFAALYREAIELARASGAKVAAASIVPIEARRYMHTISEGKSGENILKWLGDVNRLYRWQESYNQIACSVAGKLGCPILDIRSAFLQSACFPTLMSDDGIHPSPAGHALLHRTVRAALCGIE